MFNTLKVISLNMGLFLYFNLQKMPVQSVDTMVPLVSDRITTTINFAKVDASPVDLLTTALVALSYMDRLDMILLLNVAIEMPQP